MDEFNNFVKVAVSRTEQLKNRARAQQRRKEAAIKKADTRRHIFVGELVCKYFPGLKQLDPPSSSKCDIQEFVHLESTIKWLADHSDLLDELVRNG